MRKILLFVLILFAAGCVGQPVEEAPEEPVLFPDGAPCASALECEGGYCSDGICASSPPVVEVPEPEPEVEEFSLIYSHSIGTGEYGQGDYQFISMGAIAVSGSKIYIVDTGAHKIKVFSLEGTFIQSIGEGYADLFMTPLSIAADESRFYVTDQGNGRIRVFTLDGQSLFDVGEGHGTGDYKFKTPLGVDVNSQSNIYLVDQGNHRIQIYDKNGNYVGSIAGTFGPGIDQFRSMVDVAADDSKVYIADQGNHRVQVYDSSAMAYLMTVGGEYGSGDYEFMTIAAVDVDSEGRIYVVDQGNKRIQVYDSEGTYLLTVTEPPETEILDFETIVDIAVENSGLYVADQGNQVVEVFS
jgi:tripartite motif-containing protein 71